MPATKNMPVDVDVTKLHRFTICSVPKGREFWRYIPIRPTYFIIERKGTAAYKERVTVQDPLELRVGDSILFDKELPKAFIEATQPTQQRPPYALITTKGAAPPKAIETTIRRPNPRRFPPSPDTGVVSKLWRVGRIPDTGSVYEPDK